MKFMGKDRTIGYFLLVLGAALAVAAAIYYLVWAQARAAVSLVVVIGLAAGLLINVFLLFRDSDYLLIAMTAAYSTAMFKLLTDSAGSFADAYQGIVMFGDPSQVGTILSISALMLLSVIAAIIAGFLGRKKMA